MSITTAIAGATGNLGLSITRQFLSPTLKPHLSRIIALTRDPSSAKANELRNLGAEIRAVDSSSDDSLRTALEGADVVVNAIGSRSGDMKEKVLDAAVAVGAKVYFPSEFGVDHRLNDFPGYEHSEWTTKRAHVERAKQLGAGKMKIISLYTGAFLEMIVSPFAGFDVAKKKYTVVGSPNVKIAMTSKADIGKAVAQLSILASSSNATSVPDIVRIGGTYASAADVAAVQERITGDKITIESLDAAEFKEQLKQDFLAGKLANFFPYIRVIMGAGTMSGAIGDNKNELVNPKESVWKWKTFEEYAEESKLFSK